MSEGLLRHKSITVDCVYSVKNLFSLPRDLFLYYCFDVMYYATHVGIIPDKYVTLCSLTEVLVKCDAHVSND